MFPIARALLEGLIVEHLQEPVWAFISEHVPDLLQFSLVISYFSDGVFDCRLGSLPQHFVDFNF